jgi:hypothetical protein
MTPLFKAGEAEALLRAAIEGKLPDERGRFGPVGGRTCTIRNSRPSSSVSCASGSGGRPR